MTVFRAIRCLAAAGLILGLAVPPARAADKVPGLEVRTGLHKDFTRLVLESARPVPYKFSFPKADEMVITLTGAELSPAAERPRARGIIRAIEISPDDHGSRLVIRTRAPADIRRQFTLLPKAGQGARIVIDLAAADAAPTQAPVPTPARPRIMLPAPHTTITGAEAPKAAALQAPVRPAGHARQRPTEPFEVASAGGAELLFDGGTPAALAQPVEIAQAGGISINDWLMREGGNPNVRQIPPAPAPSDTVNPPAPPAYPATPVYTAPAQPAPARGTAAQPAYPVYRPYPAPSAYPAQPAPQTHPSHPGYRAAPQPASTWAPPPARGQTTPQADGESDAAARYASQKQAVPVADQTLGAPRRFYAGFGLGMGLLEYESDLNNSTLDENPFAWKLVGGFRPNEVMALELSYGKVGGFDEQFANGSSAESQFYAVTVSALMTLPLNTPLSPFARIGANLWWESADRAASVVRNEETGAGVVLGLGANYRFSERIDIRGEWELYILSDTAYTNVFAASLLYNF